jgi:transposase-like protein
MKRKRRNHLSGFKAKVALAAIKGDKTLEELAEQFDVHQNQISERKKQLLEQADTVFGSAQEQKAADAQQLKDLHAKIGELALERWSRKSEQSAKWIFCSMGA